MKAKDLFSDHAKIYAAFRPDYPEALYRFIFKHLAGRSLAWDCATGNGQVAKRLAREFATVYATDISANQLQEAEVTPNIIYSVTAAEMTTFPSYHFDLVTVGQALHWIDTDKFFAEVKRVAKPGSLLAVWGYNLLNVSPEIDPLLKDFYSNTVGPYWDSARKLLEDEYQSITFPFEQIPTPGFQIVLNWTLDHFAGYLTSWSATQNFIKTRKENPVSHFIESIAPQWQKARNVTFPVFMRLGKVGS